MDCSIVQEDGLDDSDGAHGLLLKVFKELEDRPIGDHSE